MNNWESLFHKFNDLRVLVIGDLMVDSYLFGKVDRISPEAPVPVVSVERRESRLGGAANVARNLRALGASVTIASVLGKDEQGQVLKGLLEEEQINTGGLHHSETRRTTVKHRIIGNNHQMLRVDDEDLHDLNQEEERAVWTWLEANLKDFSVVVFEDYDKGTLNESLIGKVINKANKLGIPTVVDPKKRNFLSYKKATLFKPNLKEIREGLKLDSNLKEKEELEAAVNQLMDMLEARMVMVTLSERGVLISDGKEQIHLPAHVRNIADVSGAGDTVVSVAALCLAAGAGMHETAFLSNLAGGLVCEKVGVVPVEKTKLLQEASKLS